MSVVKSRREQYTEATRAALLEAATQLFAAHGFAGTALSDVASATAVTRGAVYHHFANKQALFEAVLEKLEQEAADQAGAVAAETSTSWQAAFAALDNFLLRCCDPIYARVVWHEGPLALGWDRWEECEQRYAYGLISSLLQRLVEDGEVAPVPIAPPTKVVFFMLGAAGKALADADAAERAELCEQYASTIRRLVGGLRYDPPVG